MSVPNQDIVDRAKETGVCLWEIADKIGVSEAHFSRMRRKELDVELKTRIFTIISELKQEDKA